MNQPPDLSWQKDAKCLGTDPDLFFPENGEHGDEAKAVCADCPVRSACLEFALEHQTGREDTGIWGGTNREQRKLIRRHRAGRTGT